MNSNLSRIQSNITVKSEESVNQYTTPYFPYHHQISPTIFVSVNNHHTTRKYQSHSNREIIHISDDDEEEENENTCKNGTSIDDSSEEEQIEVIQLSDDDDDDDEGNDESSVKNMTSSLDKHKINDFHNEFDESSLELTHKNIQQQLTYFEHQSVPPTSQTEHHHQPLICPKEGVYTSRGFNISGSIMKSIGLYCPECSILIENRSELDKHLMDSHADKLPFKCMLRGCNGQFIKRFYLDNHYQDYHDTNPTTKWICSSLECKPKYTKTRNSFMAHVSKYHESGVFQCAACLAQYPHKYMVYNHHNVAHRYPRESVNKRFRCTWPQCEYIFKYMYNAFLHVRTEHLTVHGNVNQKNCDRCRGPIEFVEQIQLGEMTHEARMRQEESRIRREASRIRTKRIQNCRNYRENVR